MNIFKFILISIICFYTSFSYSEELQLSKSIAKDLMVNEIEGITIAEECEFLEFCQCPPDVTFNCSKRSDCYENQCETDSCNNCMPNCIEEVDCCCCCCCVEEELTGLAAAGAGGYGGYGGGYGYSSGVGGFGDDDDDDDGGDDDDDEPPCPIPEPKTWILMGSLLTFVAVCVRRKKQKN